MGFKLLDGNVVVVENVTLDLYDLVREVNRLLPGRASYKSRDISIDCNLQLEQNVYLKDYKKNFEFLGEYFFIKNGSIVKFGESLPYSNSVNSFSTWSGCSVTMPNIKLFGSATKDAGKFLAYDSDVEIFGEWKFLGVNSGIELIRSNVQGYGQYNGGASIMNRVRYRKTSAKHGVLKPIGGNGQYYKVDVRGTVVLDNEDNFASNSITVDETTGSLNWEYGEIDNYTTLVHMLSGSTYNGKINLLGTKVTNGYKIDNPSGDNFSLYHKYKFSGTLYNPNGLILPNSKMIIYNKKGEIEHNFFTDDNGKFDIWVTHYRNTSGAETDGEYLTPHTLAIENASSVKLSIIDNMENIPLFTSDPIKNDNTESILKIIELIEGIKVSIKENGNNITEHQEDGFDSVQLSLNVVMNALTDKINLGGNGNTNTQANLGRGMKITM